MQSISEIITFTSKIEHDLEHTSQNSELFTKPKIYTTDRDLTKRWYVYYSFRNPKT